MIIFSSPHRAEVARSPLPPPTTESSPTPRGGPCKALAEQQRLTAFTMPSMRFPRLARTRPSLASARRTWEDSVNEKATMGTDPSPLSPRQKGHRSEAARGPTVIRSVRRPTTLSMLQTCELGPVTTLDQDDPNRN